jgi:hypothetical protein
MQNQLQIQQQNNAANVQSNIATIHAKPTLLLKRIGSTTYVVSIHQSEVSKETAKDKIQRLIQREVGGDAA